MIQFTLSMPNVGSWNGKWTGADRIHARARSITPRTREEEIDGESFYYDFGDGWGASVRCKKIDSKEAAKVRRRSQGFCGYDWMINDILKYGEILGTKEREQREKST